MKYVLLKERNQHYSNEILSRKKYLYDVFKLWFVKDEETIEQIVLKSFPFNTVTDVIILLGHCDAVNKYIQSNIITEKQIIIISCYYEKLETTIKLLKDKEIYFSFLTKKVKTLSKKNDVSYETDMFDGKDYEFDFLEISNSEIKLYNFRNYTLNEKIEKCFEKWSEKYG